jgi:hypothetical protein
MTTLDELRQQKKEIDDQVHALGELLDDEE